MKLAVKLTLIAFIFSLICTIPALAAYDPLFIPSGFKPEVADLTMTDVSRKRDIPVRLYLPSDKKAAAVVMFSHGLGGSREGNVFLGEHWSARGYVAVFIQHPGSDSSVWKDKPRSERLDALKEEANFQNYSLRVKDVSAVLDQLEKWNADSGNALKGRFDLKRIGMSGHSFGAVTTQAVSGQSFIRGQILTDSRIKAAAAFSPSVPRLGGPEKAFGSVKIPWMLMTGTRDSGVIGSTTPESRLGVFPALPPGGKYELVLYGAEHLAFSDSVIKIANRKRNPNHHRAILALTTAFWDAYLRGDKEAKAWLDGAGPASILENGDRWQKK